MYTPRVRLVSSAVTFVVAIICLTTDGSRAHAAAGDSRLKELLKERLTVLQEIADQATRAYQAGQTSFAQLMEARQAAGNAELDLCETDKERIAVLSRLLTEAKEHERIVSEQVKAGAVPSSIGLKAKASRLQIEIAVERITMQTAK